MKNHCKTPKIPRTYLACMSAQLVVLIAHEVTILISTLNGLVVGLKYESTGIRLVHGGQSIDRCTSGRCG